MRNNKAIFAGGCFWCIEATFNSYKGVLSVQPGYIGGEIAHPTYEEVSKGTTGHYEALEIIFDPKIVSYEELLQVFWHNIDPIDQEGQFADRGSQYLTAVFYLNSAQLEAAALSKDNIERELNTRVATKILPAGIFYPAEEYHHKYHIKHPLRYNAYKYGSRRVEKLKQIWGEDS